jgi:ABC-type Fe3+/spermidine/putrescine transport system ATPase subunit
MQDELRALQRTTGVAFVHITHDQTEAMSLADRLVVMRAGRFVQVGRPEDVYRRPATRFVAEFVGPSNLIDATASGGGAFVTAGGLQILAVDKGDVSRGGPVTLSIRREALHIGVSGDDTAANVFDGTLRRVSFMGAVVECAIEAAGHTLEAQYPSRVSDTQLVVGQSVRVGVAVDDVVVLPAEEP